MSVMIKKLGENVMKKIVASILTAVFSIGILAGCTDYEIHEVPGT